METEKSTKIFTNAPAGRVLLGYPAVKMETHVEMQKALRRLPRLAARVAEIERLVIPKSSSAVKVTPFESTSTSAPEVRFFQIHKFQP